MPAHGGQAGLMASAMKINIAVGTTSAGWPGTPGYAWLVSSGEGRAP